MIYTPLTKLAMKIAYEAHRVQTDKSGIQYIYHPIHLAEQMDTEAECVTALLHDVAEDTDITLDELTEEFPKEVIDALRLLTRRDDEDYMEYVERIKANSIAVKVKKADLHHNSDRTRLENPALRDIERWEKYKRALAVLEE